MTQPGSIIAPQPGWWVREGSVGTNASTWGWESSTGSIPSAEAFGLPTVTPGTVTITPAGIPSAEALGTDHLVYPQSIGPAGIASAEAFGTAGFVSALLSPTGITSAEALGTPRLDLNVNPSGIVSAEAFGTAKTGVFLLPSGIVSTEAFGTPTVANAPPVFDAVGAAGSSAGTTSLTFSHTATAGATVILWVMFANNSANGSITAKYGTPSMTQVGSSYLFLTNGGFSYYLACFKFLGAPSGAQTVTVSPAVSSFINTNTESYLNAPSVGSTLATNSGTSTSASLSVSSASNHMAAQCFGFPSGSLTLSGYNQTSRWQLNGTGAWASYMQVGDAAGASSVSFSETVSPSTFWGGIGVDLI